MLYLCVTYEFHNNKWNIYYILTIPPSGCLTLKNHTIVNVGSNSQTNNTHPKEINA